MTRPAGATRGNHQTNHTYPPHRNRSIHNRQIFLWPSITTHAILHFPTGMARHANGIEDPRRLKSPWDRIRLRSDVIASFLSLIKPFNNGESLRRVIHHLQSTSAWDCESQQVMFRESIRQDNEEPWNVLLITSSCWSFVSLTKFTAYPLTRTVRWGVLLRMLYRVFQGIFTKHVYVRVWRMCRNIHVPTWDL